MREVVYGTRSIDFCCQRFTVKDVVEEYAKQLEKYGDRWVTSIGFGFVATNLPDASKDISFELARYMKENAGKEEILENSFIMEYVNKLIENEKSKVVRINK